MSTTTDVTVHSVADVPWDDVRTVFGTRGDPSGCWCQYFKLPNATFESATKDECAGMLRQQVQANDPAPGVIAYLDGEPVGWCALEPRTHYDRLRRSTIVSGGSNEDPDDASVWAVICFVVRVGYRKRGVSGALLRGAVEQARVLGARVIEGYPVDTTVRMKAPSAELYHGTLSLFMAAGFEIVSRPTRDRVVVRQAL
ncbi:GNAT family N-acetyltransferase [Cryobacterium tepidiphilum]|uniref:GNAT family N-acetyltransferase n=1 Tax=Cryobacterium tepidiphilum TaxID=2486026 RepID=A0A3M8LMS1_9MICO|nr:GNAT family N-acetyltransferase [Cryobacterium tepidiphilum]RNE66803.1 GNAT family N-acetyltransferase [Cryobacterium tepidiphilum]